MIIDLGAILAEAKAEAARRGIAGAKRNVPSRSGTLSNSIGIISEEPLVWGSRLHYAGRFHDEFLSAARLQE